MFAASVNYYYFNAQKRKTLNEIFAIFLIKIKNHFHYIVLILVGHPFDGFNFHFTLLLSFSVSSLPLKCSVSCGTGIQVRKIECVDGSGGLSTSCDIIAKPVTTQECSTGISCSSEQQVEQTSSEVRFFHVYYYFTHVMPASSKLCRYVKFKTLV